MAAVLLYAILRTPGWVGEQIGKLFRSSMSLLLRASSNVFRARLAVSLRARSEREARGVVPTFGFARRYVFDLSRYIRHMIWAYIAFYVALAFAYSLAIVLVTVLFVSVTLLASVLVAAILMILVSVLGAEIGSDVAAFSISGSGFDVSGAQIRSALQLPNVPGLRGVAQGALLAAGTLVLISSAEWLVMKTGTRRRRLPRRDAEPGPERESDAAQAVSIVSSEDARGSEARRTGGNPQPQNHSPGLPGWRPIRERKQEPKEATQIGDGDDVSTVSGPGHRHPGRDVGEVGVQEAILSLRPRVGALSYLPSSHIRHDAGCDTLHGQRSGLRRPDDGLQQV